MNAMKNKIKSQRGASITFALLLFLVCAVISGVVIVAATTAAGRMSEQADMDERYYAVTAIANRLMIVFDDKEVTLEYKKADPSDAKVVAPTDAGSILTAASKGVLEKEDKKYVPASEIKFTIDDVTCTITGELMSDGTLEFDIKASTAKNKRTFKLKQRFASTLKLSSTDSAETRATATVKWNLLGVEKWRQDRNNIAGG